MNVDGRETDFEEAWKYESGSSKLDRYRRQSLVASASQDPELTELASRLSGRERARLDLHVDEPATAAHEVRAVMLGQFVARASHAVHELTKARLGRQRWRDDLRVLAPTPGSVRVVFLEPPARTTSGGHPKIGHIPAPEADAMRQLVSLLNLAEENRTSLEAAVYQLRGPARRAVRLMSDTVTDSAWSVRGTLTLVGRDPVDVALTTSGAARLANATRLTETEPVRARMYGQADGWTWSTSTLHFVPDGGRPFDIAVPRELEAEVAAATARRDRLCVDLAGVRVHPTGDAGTERTSYALEQLAIEAMLDSD